jgi:hypothetical protein
MTEESPLNNATRLTEESLQKHVPRTCTKDKPKKKCITFGIDNFCRRKSKLLEECNWQRVRLAGG